MTEDGSPVNRSVELPTPDDAARLTGTAPITGGGMGFVLELTLAHPHALPRADDSFHHLTHHPEIIPRHA